MTTPKTPARLDADKTAQPLTRIVHHPPRGGCISPRMPLVAPEYEDENGKRTPLTVPVVEHDLTPSEVALAKVLAAWDDWKGERGPDDVFAMVCEIHDALARGAWTDLARLSDKGRALLDRARRARVL
jgi:hypothetical protein